MGIRLNCVPHRNGGVGVLSPPSIIFSYWIHSLRPLQPSTRHWLTQNNRTLFSHNLEATSLKSRCWQAMVFSKTLEKNPFFPLWDSGGCWKYLALFWIIGASLQYLPPSLCGLLCMAVTLGPLSPLLNKDISHIEFRPHSNLMWLILTWLQLQKLFPNVRFLWAWLLGEHYLTPSQMLIQALKLQSVHLPGP